MEIVPILSTIILVGTVATFILAVAAYILYKVREGDRSTQEAAPPEAPDPHILMRPNLNGEIGAPVSAATFIAPTSTERPQGTYIEAQNSYGPPGHPAPAALEAGETPLGNFFWEYTDEGFAPLEFESERRAEQARLEASARAEALAAREATPAEDDDEPTI